eukprot:6190248-Amphidinium_carterae.1
MFAATQGQVQKSGSSVFLFDYRVPRLWRLRVGAQAAFLMDQNHVLGLVDNHWRASKRGQEE